VLSQVSVLDFLLFWEISYNLSPSMLNPFWDYHHSPSPKWEKRKEKKFDKLWTLFFLDKTIDYTGRKERKRMSITKSVWWIGSYSSIYWDLQIMRDVKPMFQSLTNPIFKAMWRSPSANDLEFGVPMVCRVGSVVVLLKEAQEQNYLKIMILVNWRVLIFMMLQEGIEFSLDMSKNSGVCVWT
jgi:hypothetical protein